jgi:hypothetical protein
MRWLKPLISLKQYTVAHLLQLLPDGNTGKCLTLMFLAFSLELCLPGAFGLNDATQGESFRTLDITLFLSGPIF